MGFTRQPPGRLLQRSLLRQCPQCGQGGLFRRWITMRAECPQCGLYFEREQGYWLGAVIINTAATFGLFLLIGVTIGFITWPEVPWKAILVITLAFNGLFPILFYPFSKTLWVALDLAVRPVEIDKIDETPALPS